MLVCLRLALAQPATIVQLQAYAMSLFANADTTVQLDRRLRDRAQQEKTVRPARLLLRTVRQGRAVKFRRRAPHQTVRAAPFAMGRESLKSVRLVRTVLVQTKRLRQPATKDRTAQPRAHAALSLALAAAAAIAPSRG
jgi:hypothetical protein